MLACLMGKRPVSGWRRARCAVRVDDSGTLRIGFGEPDWLGPARLETPGPGASPVAGASGGIRLESDWVVGEVARASR